MTTEHLLLIDFADLRAVRINCTKCKTTSLFHLGAPKGIQKQCNCDWGSSLPVDAKLLSGNLVKAIQEWRNQAATAPLQLQFELSLPIELSLPTTSLKPAGKTNGPG